MNKTAVGPNLQSLAGMTQAIARMAEEPTPGPIPCNDRLQILFVDDEERVLSGLRRMLRGKRSVWEMTFVLSGEEALEHLATHPVDVVVSDMRMPIMDGLALQRRVQELYPATIRFILSGNAEQSEVLKAVGPVHQYLAKPCDPELLQSSLDRSARLKAMLRRVEDGALLECTDNLPVLPSVYREIQETLRSDQCDLQRLGTIIERDPGLTLRILKIVNSAYFGLNRVVADVTEALAVLGLEAVQGLVVGVKTFSDLSLKGQGAQLCDLLWGHSQRVAALARRVAVDGGLDQQGADNAFFAGLMHDVGIVLLLSRKTEVYLRLLHASREYKVPLESSEVRILKVSHSQLSGFLLGIWGISDVVCEAVVYHHQPSMVPNDGKMTPLAAVVIADAIDGHLNPLPSPFPSETSDISWIRDRGFGAEMARWIECAKELKV